MKEFRRKILAIDSEKVNTKYLLEGKNKGNK